MSVGPEELFLLLNPDTGPEQTEHLDRPLDPSEIEIRNVPWVGTIRYENQVIEDAEKTRPVKLLPRGARCFTSRPRNKRNPESINIAPPTEWPSKPKPGRVKLGYRRPRRFARSRYTSLHLEENARSATLRRWIPTNTELRNRHT